MPGVLSFAHLKKGAVGAKEVKKPKNAVDVVVPKAASFLHEDLNIKQVPTATTKKGIKSSSLLVESKFCYGCTSFSIDAPETLEEAAWCKRKMEDGGNEFKRVPNHAMVKQCPKVKKGDIVLA